MIAVFPAAVSLTAVFSGLDSTCAWAALPRQARTQAKPFKPAASGKASQPTKKSPVAPDAGQDADTPPLIAAALAENLARVKALLGKGTDPNTHDADGMAALMAAAEAGNAPAVKLLLAQGAEPNHQSNGGGTALMLAAKKGRYAICEMLLKKGANPMATNKAGETARALAENASLTGIVTLLKQQEKP